MEVIRDVTFRIDFKPVQLAIDELLKLISDLPRDLIRGRLRSVLDSLIDCFVNRRFYTHSKTMSADRTTHDIVFIPSREFSEYVTAIRVGAGER